MLQSLHEVASYTPVAGITHTEQFYSDYVFHLDLICTSVEVFSRLKLKGNQPADE